MFQCLLTQMHTHSFLAYSSHSSYFLCNGNLHKANAYYRCPYWETNMKIIRSFNVSTHTSFNYILLIFHAMKILTKLMPIVDAFVEQIDMKIIKHFNVSHHTHA